MASRLGCISDRSDPDAIVLRWLLVGSLFVGMGLGLRNGWVEVRWEKMAQDLNMPFLAEPDPFRGLRPESVPPVTGERDSSSRQER